MITEEQIRKLKPGDPLVIHCEYIKHLSSGDIVIKCLMVRGGELSTDNKYVHRSCVSLPTEYKTVINARDIFRNMSEGEKACISNFLSSYFREATKQEEIRNALKKMGIDLTNIRPKYDPTRLFKKGDRVRIKSVNGRHWNLWTKEVENQIFVVDADEVECNCVYLGIGVDQTCGVDAHYLELVTPVEEMEPYKLIDSPNTYNIVRDSATVMTIHKKSHPSAKAAAESARDRLNAEWRKEQNND